MKTIPPSYKLLALITQLLLLGGCGFFGIGSTQSSSVKVPIEPADLKPDDKKCLAALKEGLDKYKSNTQKDIGDLSNSPISLQTIITKTKNWSSDLQVLTKLPDCAKIPLDKSVEVKKLIDEINSLNEVTLMINDPKLDAKAKEDGIKAKIGSSELLPSENPNNNPAEVLPRLFLKYTGEKLQDLLKQLAKIPSPNSLQAEEIQKQINAHTDRLTGHDIKLDELQARVSNQNIMMSAFLLLLPVVGVAGYFLGQRLQTSDIPDNNNAKKRATKQSGVAPASHVSNDPTQKTRGLGGLGGSSRKSTHSKETPSIRVNDEGENSLKFRLNDKTKNRITPSDIPEDISEQGAIISSQQRLDLSRNQKVNTSYSASESVNKPISQPLTYELAIHHYNDGNYDLLQNCSRGYYSATSDSMMRNREFWGNPLELIEAFDGYLDS